MACAAQLPSSNSSASSSISASYFPASFRSVRPPPSTRSLSIFKKSLGDLLGKELPAETRGHLVQILDTISTIIDSDSSGDITEVEFITSGRLFLLLANGDSPFDNPDIFFDILDADKSGTVDLMELSKLFTALLPPGTDDSMIKSISSEIISTGDSSGTGSLTREDMRSMASKLRDMFAK